MSGTQHCQTFAGLPTRDLDQLQGATVAILGASEASPYKLGAPSHSAHAPQALRAASAGFAEQLWQYDFDLGAVFLDKEGISRGVVDCGDVETTPDDPEGNRARITAAVRRILIAGAVPVVLGGDDSVPIPVFQAYEGRGPLTVVQIDAHVDWGDVIKGNPFGYGSTMRRVSEMAWIKGMVQVGMRGLGSGSPDQIEDARRWGSRLVSAPAFRQHGVEQVLKHIPAGADCLVTIDCDGLDPSIMPAVGMPTPGGLLYQDVLDLLHGIVATARVIGFCLVEFVPDKDPFGLAALTAARIVGVSAGLMRAPSS
jgi:agmatinase